MSRGLFHAYLGLAITRYLAKTEWKTGILGTICYHFSCNTEPNGKGIGDQPLKTCQWPGHVHFIFFTYWQYVKQVSYKSEIQTSCHMPITKLCPLPRYIAISESSTKIPSKHSLNTNTILHPSFLLSNHLPSHLHSSCKNIKFDIWNSHD